ncbi:hypothetical protein K435DRAFT_868526 [Dendrothele bispora CBS 962.96]|uniref:Uncharacterized protein n=1 Tax=Dendrothele bispora (strain CBS 962.96) TaxID=1314807 RepID=A0A4S8LCX0_DENBC|nr:hypothetical protein K435DRAFT_868526 [Dendrothele bispora CBS 962.96]
MTQGYQAHTDEAHLGWAFAFTASREVPADFLLPERYGSSYVDLDLKVVVRSASATLTSFKPGALHETTYAEGAVNFGMSMTGTQRVRDAYEELMQKKYKVDYGLLTNKHDEEGSPESEKMKQ